jgi:hypothetical protein
MTVTINSFKGLEDAYSLVMENNGKGTVDTKLKVGQSSVGENKMAKDQGIESPNAKVKKPVASEKNLNSNVKKESLSKEEIQNMLPESKFDKLFKSTLVEEEAFGSDDENPLGNTGDGEFSDEEGDFPSEGGSDSDMGGEVDVATELRMIIDRLTEIAEKLGSYDEETDEAGGQTPEGEEGMGDEGEEPVKPALESVTYGKGGSGKAGGPGKGSADGKLGKFPDTAKKMQSKGSMKVSASSAMGKQTAKGKACACGPKETSGKLKPFTDKASSMQSKSNMTVKSEMGKVGRSIFD